MTIVIESEPQAAQSSHPSNSRLDWLFLAALVVSAFIWLLGWYGDTLRSMIETWVRSETFAHGFLIVPISAWMIWRKRHVIASLNPKPNFWMLLPLAILGFCWLLANLAAVVVVQQYCLVFMILFLIATLLGNQVVKELAFPLLFLLFAVPFGEFMLPTLMEHTADVAVFALRLSGIPVYREGLFFSIPSGNWSVVEACSGLRYLIASVTLGCLYAYLTYRSIKRRVAFILMSIVVPLVANWLRAYLIVMIGHLSSMKLATGVDHLIYGWLFFGIVMLVLFWIGSFWREDNDESEIAINSEARLRIGHASWMALLAAAVVSAGLVTASPLVAARLQNISYVQPVVSIPVGKGGWQAEGGTLTDWVPYYVNSSARINQVYRSGTKRIELHILYFRNQREDAKLITSRNALVGSGNRAWGQIAEVRRSIAIENGEVMVVESKLRGQSTRLVVWHWYWVDGQYTVSPFWAKFLQAKSQFMGRGDDGAVIIVSMESDESGNVMIQQFQDFVKSMHPEIDKSLKMAR